MIQLQSPPEVARRLLLVALLVAAVAAGCGKVKSVTPNEFSLDATKECLEDEQSLRVSTDDAEVGLIGSTASGGALRVYVDGNSAVVLFGEDAAEVADLQRAFGGSVSTPRERKRLASLLEPRGNALVDWISEPKPADAAVVRDCLT